MGHTQQATQAQRADFDRAIGIYNDTTTGTPTPLPSSPFPSPPTIHHRVRVRHKSPQKTYTNHGMEQLSTGLCPCLPQQRDCSCHGQTSSFHWTGYNWLHSSKPRRCLDVPRTNSHWPPSSQPRPVSQFYRDIGVCSIVKLDNWALHGSRGSDLFRQTGFLPPRSRGCVAISTMGREARERRRVFHVQRSHQKRISC